MAWTEKKFTFFHRHGYNSSVYPTATYGLSLGIRIITVHEKGKVEDKRTVSVSRGYIPASFCVNPNQYTQN